MTGAHAELHASFPTLGPVAEPRTHRDLLPLVATAVLLALACRGHFVKPHGDFYEFRETGQALLHGELPRTFKRAPVFPVLVAATGTLLGAILTTEMPPDQVAAGWINALLLPCNVLLCYLIGRRWLGGSARWAALWLMLLPTGLYCTAHALVEPLLVSTVLLTIWLAQRGSSWAYPAAALACVTRYDAAGVLAGLALADGLCRGRWGRVTARASLTLLPLLLWLALTAVTWETRSQDHYLQQIREHACFGPGWPLAATLRCAFGPETLSLPVWGAEWEPWLRGAIWYGLALGALLGLAGLLWRRDAGVLVAGGFLVGYVLVHAFFPFQFFRFGYPPVPLVLLAAGVGGHIFARTVSDTVRSRGVRGLLAILAALPLLLLAGGEAARLRALLALPHDWLDALPFLALAGVTLVWVSSWHGRRSVAWRLLVYLAFCSLALVQIRLALPLLGDGAERINDVRAARWVRANTLPTEGVLSDSPGLLRLYAGDRPRERFIGLGEIRAERWPEILAECRARGVRYMIWHDEVFREQGAYYIRKWRLERFAGLANPTEVPGVEVAVHYAGHPNLWILRVLEE